MTDKKQISHNSLNDGADFWNNKIGVNVTPADSKNKLTYEKWSQWQNTPISLEQFEQWKKEGKFDSGIAIILGKIWRGNYEGKYLVGIDCDNQKAIDECCTIGHDEKITIEQLANQTIVEQHKDQPNKAHIYFLSTKPVKKKSSDKVNTYNSEKINVNDIPAIEVKGSGEHGIMCCSPSIHKNGFPYEIIGTKTPALLDDIEEQLGKIFQKYGIPYLDKSNEKNTYEANSDLIPIKELFKPDFVICEGHNRHEALLRAMESLIKRNKEILELKDIRELAKVWNQQHCKPPLEEAEVNKQWICAIKFVDQARKNKSNNKNEKKYTASTNVNKSQKHEFTVFKYSEKGKSNLYEAIILNGIPYFICYTNNKINFVQRIEQNDRILIPPKHEEYPYDQYEFESQEEIDMYVNMAIKENTASLYKRIKKIISKFNNQDTKKLNLISSDIFLSYFQDRFSTVNYLLIVGGNGSGKSSLGDTIGALGYRVVTMTDPTAPNLFRLLGVIEPAQCTMVLEEAERIDQSQDLMNVLKTGYAYNGKVPRINTNNNKQEFFYSFCQKIIIAERTPNPTTAKGVLDRTFTINSQRGIPNYDIKEILNRTETGSLTNKTLLKEILDTRKLLLIYRLIHFKNPIQDIDIGIHGRDKELTKPLIQLFYKTEVEQEVVDTLQYFIDLKNQKKEAMLEQALIPIIKGLIEKHGKEFLFNIFWQEIKNNIAGKGDEKKPNEYHTDDYGTFYRTSITNMLRDIFGVKTRHKRNGNILIFDTDSVNITSQQFNNKIKIVENDVNSNSFDFILKETIDPTNKDNLTNSSDFNERSRHDEDVKSVNRLL